MVLSIQKSDTRLIRGVTLVVIAAFSLIFSLVIAGYLTETKRVAQSDVFSKVIQATSEVGTISQKLALVQFGSLSKRDPTLLEKLNHEVARELERFEGAEALIVKLLHSEVALQEETKARINELLSAGLSFKASVRELQRAPRGDAANRESISHYAEQAVQLLALSRMSASLVAGDAATKAEASDETVRAYYFFTGLAVLGAALFIGIGLIVRLRRELKLRRAIEQKLLKANQDLEHFSSVVAHDLKAPLTTIAFSAKMLSEEQTNTHGLMDTIAAETNRLREMVQALLRLSHTQTLTRFISFIQLHNPAIDRTTATLTAAFCLHNLPTLFLEHPEMMQQLNAIASQLSEAKN